jgi:phosphate-selective porin OprO and OprP
MDLRPYGRAIGRLSLGIAALLSGTTLAVAQTPPLLPTPPIPAAANPVAPAAEPSAPAVAPPAALAVMAPPAPREAALEDRIRQLESMVNQLSGQVQQISTAPPPPVVAAPMPGNAAESSAARPDSLPNVLPSRSGGLGAPGQSLPPNPASNKRFASPATLESHPGHFKFGPGFELRSEDDEFFFQFHNLTQVDYRGYQQGGQTQVKDTFGIPRQWFMFSGRINKPVGYFVSLAQGFDTLNGLDMFMDWNPNTKFNLRLGRMKTPFTYEFLVEPIQGLINPERSVFFNNFGQNRDVGVMAYGRLLNNTIDYAAGVWNGSRNGYVALQNAKAVSAFINWKPFGNHEGSMLENFNIGGSVYAVNNNQIALPQTFRTAVPTTGNAVLGVPFMFLNSNVRETGQQAFWDLHAAWFYQQLAVIAEWQSGVKDYSLSSTPYDRTRLPIQSFYVQAGYLLTGETRSSVGIVKPNNPFSLKDGGIGAWELVTRYQFMDIGSQVFTGGLADPNTSANRLYITDLGFNWHLTQYVKFYFEWEHAVFNQPVTYAPGKSQLTSDMFLARFQLYF